MPSSIADLEEAYGIIYALHKDGLLADASFYKCVLALAHDYATVDKFQEAMSLVTQVNDDYLVNDMPRQLLDDQLFARIIVGLSKMLKDNGFVSADVAEKDYFGMINGPRGQA